MPITHDTTPGAAAGRHAPAAAGLLVAALLALLLVAPTAAKAAAPDQLGSPAPLSYSIGTCEDCDGVNPFGSWSPISRECLLLGYDFLTWYDAEYGPAADVATSWEVSEDGLTWTFRLRRGMEWHDGVELTAADVVFTYDLVLDTRQPGYIEYLAGVTGVHAPDDHTVVVTTRRPKADMLAIAVPILPEHIWSQVDRDRLDEFENLPLVGSGPFRVTAVDADGEVTLAPNPAYPQALGGRPALSRLTFAVGRDPDALLEDYRAGKLDAVADLPATLRSASAAAPGTTTAAGPALGFRELGFNCRPSPRSTGDPLLRDASIRRAVHWAIDKQELVDAATAGLAVPGSSVVSPAQGEWRWEAPPGAAYRYDPPLARRILEDAGYADADGDGIREDADGHRLSFRLAAPAESPTDLAAARMIRAWCRDIGVELRLEKLDGAELRARVAADADYDVVLWSRAGDIDPGSVLGAYTTREVTRRNATGYSDPVYDRLYQLQARALDPADPEGAARRADIVVAMQKLLYRDVPSIVLWYDVNLQAFRTDRWAGYAPAPGGDGAPFRNRLRSTYISLRPVRVAPVAVEASGAWVWGVVAGAVAIAAVGFALLRRRSRPTEDA